MTIQLIAINKNRIENEIFLKSSFLKFKIFFEANFIKNKS